MPTPNTYDLNYFKDILAKSGNVFHQTSVGNLANILNAKAIYSPGTLWGMIPNIASGFYLTNSRRASNLQHRANTGFVDYVFCSFQNSIQSSNKLYGTVSIEINKDILLEKECFIYPFNFVFSWGGAGNSDKYSDLSVWSMVVNGSRPINYNEILVRRKVNLAKYGVKFHCFASVRHKVLGILEQFGYSEANLELHDDPVKMVGSDSMTTEMIAEINGEKYQAILTDDRKFASIFNVISDDDGDFLGKFEVDKDGNLVENFPMSGSSKIVGKLLTSNSTASAKTSVAN